MAVQHRVHAEPLVTVEPPPLHMGDQLTRVEFERIYDAHPEIKKAELVEGVVYMPSPLRHKQHGAPHMRINGWLTVYAAATPGTDLSDNVTVRLDLENEVQPDALLRLETEKGGKSRITEDDFIDGPPELVAEIAASSAAYDLHQKRHVYQRSAVQEYLAIQVYEKRIDWFALRKGVYQTLPTSEAGVIQSAVFPGLWLDTTAFWDGDLKTMLEVLQKGLGSAEHAEFVTRLQDAKS